MQALSQVFLFEDDAEISRLLSFTLESQFNLPVTAIPDGKEGLARLNDLSSFHLVILGQVSHGEELANHLVTLPDEQSPKIILATATKIQNPALLMHPNVLGVIERKSMVEGIADLLRQGTAGGGAAGQKHCRVPSSLLLRLPVLPSDVYIRLSDEKYVKLFQSGDRFDSADESKYAKAKRVEYFYVSPAEVPAYLGACRQEIDRLLSAARPDAQEVKKVTIDLQDALHSLVRSLGATEEVLQLAHDNMKVILKNLDKSTDFSALFKRFENEKDKYIVTHSVLLAEVACLISSKLSMPSEATCQKLVMAALFHDILVRNHELAKCATLQQAQAQPELLTLESIEDYRQHPTKAAALARKMKNCPPDVDFVIAQHHEDADGSGFPEAINHLWIAPLAAVFIVAHDFVDDVLLGANPEADIFAFIQRNKLRYAQGNFRKIAQILEVLR